MSDFDALFAEGQDLAVSPDSPHWHNPERRVTALDDPLPPDVAPSVIDAFGYCANAGCENTATDAGDEPCADCRVKAEILAEQEAPVVEAVYAHGTPYTDEDPAIAALILEENPPPGPPYYGVAVTETSDTVEVRFPPPPLEVGVVGELLPEQAKALEEAGVKIVALDASQVPLSPDPAELIIPRMIAPLTPEEESAAWTEAYLTSGGGAELPTEEKEAIRQKVGLQSHAARVTTSSKKMDWGSPRAFYEKLDAEFGFQLDACAHARNYKHVLYFDEEQDALKQDWMGLVVFLNPPYGRLTPVFLRKAFEESLKGATVVCLIAARIGTEWWQECVVGKADEVRIVKGRLAFEDGDGNTDSATFDSAVVVYRPPYARKHTYMTYMER